MTVYIARYHMRENVNGWPQNTWTYSQGVNAADPNAAVTEATAFAGVFMIGHSSSIVCEGVGVYSAPKGDKLFQFQPLAINGSFNIGGLRLPLWNTAYTQIVTAEGRVGFHHWRIGWGTDNIIVDNEWDSSPLGVLNAGIITFITDNPDVLCKPNGTIYIDSARTDVKIHMRQFGARTPVGGRKGKSPSTPTP